MASRRLDDAQGAARDVPGAGTRRAGSPAPLGGHVLRLQRHAGNAAVAVAVQARPAARLQRKVGFEAELMVPSLGPSHNTLAYPKKPTKVTAAIKSFLDGGVPYGTDIGGKAEDKPIRIDSDHSSQITRAGIIDKLTTLGYVTGDATEPKTKIEFVTHALDELAPKSNTAFKTLGLDLKGKLEAAVTSAKSGAMHQLAEPAKVGYFTGVPVADLKAWLGVADYAEIDALVTKFLEEQTADAVYLQATVGIIPSGLRTFLGTAKLPGGKVRLDPPSEARQQLIGIVEEVVTRLEANERFTTHEWFQGLGGPDREAFMGIVSLVYSYLLADTLHKTTAGTASTAKNAVPFLIKRAPWNLTAMAGTHNLRTKPPPKDVARGVGYWLSTTKYLKPAYWIESDEGTAKQEGKITEAVEARAPSKGFLTGDYIDIVEAMLIGGVGGVSAVVGKEVPAADALPALSGAVKVHWESYYQAGIPLEYRWITKQYKVAEILPALSEIIGEVRTANMKELTAEQKEQVNAAIKEE
ncbi:MAG: DUF4157 domain-containing protein [Solirubrobacteraceae bacterium]